MQDNLHVALKQIGPLHYDTVLAGDQVTMYCGQAWFTITAKVASHEGLGNQCNALDRFVPIAVVAGLSISGAALLYPVAVAAMSGGAAAAGAGVLGGGAVLAKNLKKVKGWWDIGSSALSEHVSEPFKNEYAIGRYLTRLSERDVISSPGWYMSGHQEFRITKNGSSEGEGLSTSHLELITPGSSSAPSQPLQEPLEEINISQ